MLTAGRAILNELQQAYMIVKPKRRILRLLDYNKQLIHISYCSGFFSIFTRLPPTVLLLYWAGLSPAILGPSVLSKRVEIGSTGTQNGLACVQTMPRLPGACLW